MHADGVSRGRSGTGIEVHTHRLVVGARRPRRHSSSQPSFAEVLESRQCGAQGGGSSHREEGCRRHQPDATGPARGETESDQTVQPGNREEQVVVGADRREAEHFGRLGVLGDRARLRKPEGEASYRQMCPEAHPRSLEGGSSQRRGQQVAMGGRAPCHSIARALLPKRHRDPAESADEQSGEAAKRFWSLDTRSRIISEEATCRSRVRPAR
jgi:hypothetical protein